jgi:hypothetical protein
MTWGGAHRRANAHRLAYRGRSFAVQRESIETI